MIIPDILSRTVEIPQWMLGVLVAYVVLCTIATVYLFGLAVIEARAQALQRERRGDERVNRMIRGIAAQQRRERDEFRSEAIRPARRIAR